MYLNHSWRLIMPKNSEKPMHELFGDEYIEAAFEMWIEECELQVFALFEATRAKLYRQFKAAFMHGLTACSNGNVY